ncbi:MAG: ABC transporter permease [Chloroflexi bacterium]|nr:ABC transporter permease [Chloroflexota bacterium]
MTPINELPELPQIQFSDRSTSGPWMTAVKRLFRQHSGIAGMIILGVLVLTAVFAPIIAPYGPNEVLIGKENIRKRAKPCIHLLGCPADQPQHLAGVDGNVRDEFSRLVYGSRISIFIGFVTIGFAIITGTFLGTIAGYVGGTTSNIIMRTLDVVLAFPFLLLAIAIVAILGPGLVNAMMAIAIVNIPTYARVIRASVLSVREEEYITAALSIGAGHRRILLQHVLPNAFPPLIVLATLGIGTAILETAGLSFLGLGSQPPDPEWGAMLASERNQVFSAPHLVFLPGLAIMLTVLGFNLLGDGLRDALDPRLRL